MAKKKLLAKKTAHDPKLDAIIKLAIMAVGGQGGGVLSSWIVDLAQRNGYQVQATSVAGVAQRTGATIYYIEMLPATDQQPVFSLAPSPGDVDIVIAAELMEAGRAIMRGFVTADRTTLITSTHRAYATAEKIAPGNAIADTGLVMETARNASATFIAFDMESIANEAETVISAGLFGALAGSGTLPFPEDDYEGTIKTSGRNVEANLKAFRLSCAVAKLPVDAPDASIQSPAAEAKAENLPKGPSKLLHKWQQLNARIQAMPGAVHKITQLGLNKVVDFQDVAYGAEFLDRIDQILLLDTEEDYVLTTTAAKYIANAMAYDDIIWVADIKTRKSRFERISSEVGHGNNQTLHITEYFHPGGREFCSLLPAGIGRAVETRPKLFNALDWLVNRGRRVRSDTIFWFTILYLVSGLRKFRRKLLRHKVEQKHLDSLINEAVSKVETNYELAIEIFKCQRLIKGYSDTHQRGLSKFSRVITGIKLVEDRDDGADWARRLRDAALGDVEGDKLDGVLKTIRTFMKTE